MEPSISTEAILIPARQKKKVSLAKIQFFSNSMHIKIFPIFTINNGAKIPINFHVHLFFD
jgi:hypothetical protein